MTLRMLRNFLHTVTHCYVCACNRTRNDSGSSLLASSSALALPSAPGLRLLRLLRLPLRALPSAMPIVEANAALMSKLCVLCASAALHCCARAFIESFAKLCALAVLGLALVWSWGSVWCRRRRAGRSPAGHMKMMMLRVAADGVVFFDSFPRLLHVRLNQQTWVLHLLSPPAA